MADLGKILGNHLGEINGAQAVCTGAIVTSLVGLGVITRDDAVAILRDIAESLRKPISSGGAMLEQIALGLSLQADALERGDPPTRPFALIEGGRRD